MLPKLPVVAQDLDSKNDPPRMGPSVSVFNVGGVLVSPQMNEQAALLTKYVAKEAYESVAVFLRLLAPASLRCSFTLASTVLKAEGKKLKKNKKN